MSTCKTNKLDQYNHKIVIWKGVLKTVWHNTVFMWWNIGFPATTPIIFLGLLHLKKGQPKGKHCGKDCQKATDSKFYACLDTNLGKVLFHYIMLWDKEKGNFPIRFIASPSVEFPKICWTIKHICALPSAYWKKS